MDLDIVTGRTDDAATLVLRGSVDLASRDELLAAARSVLADSPPTTMIIDLAGVTFFDSTGIGALVLLDGECADAGTTFAVRSPSPPVARVMQISGLSDAWPLSDASSLDGSQPDR